ncbi:MAG: prepilin-type N-terminal cleavage/methylation domain-containing protein [Candidatus Omnitrophica bacterium]|nr:prepilin-type N-terminal cleavage/methylation domain-containing protein [Candidatus Omnitrophota bacterium]
MKLISGFTLLELIVVIVILGILATLGYTQYTKVVEKGRGAEARSILGQCRKSAIEYYLKNGVFTGISNTDINVGSSSDQIPSSCRSTHYFFYGLSGEYTNPNYIIVHAGRCTSGGKPPQISGLAGIALVIVMTGTGHNNTTDGTWVSWNSSGGVWWPSEYNY